jgi:hypothetical protein
VTDEDGQPGKVVKPIFIPVAGLLTLNAYFLVWLYRRYSEINRAEPEATGIPAARALRLFFVPVWNVVWIPYVVYDLGRTLRNVQLSRKRSTLLAPFLPTTLILFGFLSGAIVIVLLVGAFAAGFRHHPFDEGAVIIPTVLGDIALRHLILLLGLLLLVMCLLPVWSGMILAQVSLNWVWTIETPSREPDGDAARIIRSAYLRRAVGSTACLLFLVFNLGPLIFTSRNLCAALTKQGTRLALVSENESGRPLSEDGTRAVISALRERLARLDIHADSLEPGTSSEETAVAILPPWVEAERVKQVLSYFGTLQVQALAKGGELPYSSRTEAEDALTDQPGGIGAFEIASYREAASYGGSSSEGWLVLEKPPLFTGSDINKASAEPAPYGHQYQIVFALEPDAAARFEEWTSTHIGGYLAVVINDQVVSTASIRSPISDRGMIEGNFDKESAENVASALGSGLLPWKMRVGAEQAFSRPQWLIRPLAFALLCAVSFLIAAVIFYTLSKPPRTLPVGRTALTPPDQLATPPDRTNG